jgi:hypothetical protein
VKPAECRIEFQHHLAEGSSERRPPADQHIIMARAHSPRPGGHRKPHDLTQTAPYPVALHRVADLARHREADAHGPVVGAAPRLKHKKGPGGTRTIRRGSKIGAASQPLDDGNGGLALTH